MRGWDDWEDSMERFVIDPDTVDRLLSGALDPEDAPHRFGEVAALLQAAATPTSGALDGEAAERNSGSACSTFTNTSCRASFASASSFKR